MAFWLDDPGRRSAYPPLPDLAPLEVEAAFRQSEPAIIHAAPPKRGRRPQLVPILSAITAAAGFHVGVALLLSWSASKAKPNIRPPADTAAMFASLTPASSISLQPTVQPPSPRSAAETVSDVSDPPSQTLAATSDAPPPTETNASPAAQSAEVDEATLNTALTAAATVTPLHEDTDNPWAHASAPVPVPSMSQKLWAAIKPCLKDGGQGSPPIRLVLNDQGRVQRMTDLEGGEAEADPRLGPVLN